jgi:hypothetical protein
LERRKRAEAALISVVACYLLGVSQPFAKGQPFRRPK